MHGGSPIEHNNEDLYDEVLDVKAKIAELQYDLKRFLEHSNREHIEGIVSGLRTDLLGAVADHLDHDAERGLQNGMVPDCPMHKTCKMRFNELLHVNAVLFKEETVRADAIDNKRFILHGMAGESAISSVYTMLY